MSNIDPEQLAEQPIELFTPSDALDFSEDETKRFQPVMNTLMATRHKIFDLPETSMDRTQAIDTQLYPDATYNNGLIKADLSLRKGNSLEFHQETEKYNPLPDDSEALAHDKALYRQAILSAALELGGFTAEAPSQGTNDIERRLGIIESTTKKINQPVEAIVVAAAAGLSSYKRFYDTIRDIESGKVHTSDILFTACDRVIPEQEKNNVAAKDFEAGSTEYESSQKVVEQLLGVTFSDEQELAVPYGPDGTPARFVTTQAVIGDTLVTIKVVSAPVDSSRTLDDGRPAVRANTEETFLALENLLKPGAGLLVVKSHDAWIPYQNIKAKQTFGLEFGKQTVVNGPYNVERLYYRTDEQGNQITDIYNAEGVIDEIAKCQDDLVKLRVAVINKEAA